jgi:hypothetical protein
VWADNETDLDLLGFDVLVDELMVALTEPRLLPLTVGVLGGWGSGKSSLLKITRAELEAVEGRPYVCVEFSPWQYEDYGDVKAGLMRAVLDQCRPRMKPAAEEDVRRMKAFASRFARRSRQAGRAAVVAAPAMTPAVAGLIDPTFDPTTVDAAKAAATALAGVVGESLKDKEAPAPAASPIDNIEDVEDFRRVFEEFVKGLDGVDAVVVFIDDLDRCLPDTVIDTFEAIRLFLNVPRSAFVVAASRQIVEAAIDSRYPELKRENGQGIGHDYLEKMLQLQVSVPPLSAAETETYVNLLVSQLHVKPEQFNGACRSLRERASDPFAPSYSAAVAADLLGDAFTTALSDDMAWATEIAPALSGLGGNPRRIKRFLNDLTWRRRAASRRGVQLRQDVLAKLMVLEDQSGEDFQTLFDWQVRAAGPSPELVFAETLARGDSQKEEVPEGASRRAKKAEKEPAIPPAADPVAELATGWAERPMVRRWLQLQPDLRETDLRPYFSYFRDRLVIGAVASALRPDLQVLLGKITSDVPLVSRKACGDVEKLPPPDQDEIVRALLDSVQRRPDGAAMFPMCEIAARVPRLAPTVCEGLSRLPHQVLAAPIVVGVARRLDKVPERADLFAGWTSSPVDAVAKAAAAAMRPRAGS